MDFTVPDNHRVKLKDSEKKFKYLDLARNFFLKNVEHESDDYTNCNWWAQYRHQRIGSGAGGHENKRASRDYPNFSIFLD